MATMSFFIKDIAFSRLLLPLSVAASGALLAFFRLSARPPAERTDERVLVGGRQAEHERRTRVLADHASGQIGRDTAELQSRGQPVCRLVLGNEKAGVTPGID